MEWVSRATRIAEEHMRKAGVDDWVAAQRKRKWDYAGQVARREDGRWSTKLLAWEPAEGKRKRGHPKLRWRDDLDAFWQQKMQEQPGFWMIAAMNEKG